VHADRDKSEQQFDRTSILSCHPKHQTHPISGRQVGLWSRCSCDAWEPCAAAERLVEAAQRPSPGLTAPDATMDTPDTLGGAEGRVERGLPEYLDDQRAALDEWWQRALAAEAEVHRLERALSVERARVARVERLVAHLHTDLVYAGDIRAALAEPEATEGGK